jgi:glycosyltransferase involved in cell wall biosynthesis
MYKELSKHHHIEIMGNELLRQLSVFEKDIFPENQIISSGKHIECLNRLLSERINALCCDVVFFGDLPFMPFLNINVPIVCVSDMTFEQNRSRYIKPDEINDKYSMHFERLMLSNASDIIYSSEWIKNKAIEVYGIKPQKIHVVEFGANIPYSDDYSVEIDTDVCRLVFIGADWKRKGGDKVLETYRILKRRGFPCSLTIIGSNPEYMRYRDNDLTVIPKLDKADDQQLAKLCEILKESHFLFLPTVFDAFGIVFCEASAYAVPSITANVGGVGQAVNDGKNGFLLSPDATAQDYADKIMATFSDRESYIWLRASARDEFETRLNWSVWGERVNSILENAIKNYSA